MQSLSRYISLLVILLSLSCFGQAFTMQDTAWLGNAIPKSSAPAAYAPTNTYAYYDPSSISLADGLLVTNWNDSSGNGKTMWAYAANPGTYSPYFSNSVSTINSKPAVVWSGAQSMTNAFGSTLNPPWTIILVAQALGNSQYYLDGCTSSPRMVYDRNGSSPNQDRIYNGTAFLGGPSSLVAGKWYVITLYFNGASSYMRTNGVNYAEPGTDIGSAGSKGLTFGARYDFTGNKANTKFAYIILRNATMNTNDLQWDESSLKTKFGL